MANEQSSTNLNLSIADVAWSECNVRGESPLRGD
jgi:hypothetical protein